MFCFVFYLQAPKSGEIFDLWYKTLKCLRFAEIAFSLFEMSFEQSAHMAGVHFAGEGEKCFE